MKTIAAIAIALATLQGSLAQSVSLPQCGVCHCFILSLTFRVFVWFNQSASRPVRLRTSSVSAPTLHISIKPSTVSTPHARPPMLRTLISTRPSPAQTPVSLSPASTRFYTREAPEPVQLPPLLQLARPLPLSHPLIPLPLLPTPPPALQTLLHQARVIPPIQVQW